MTTIILFIAGIILYSFVEYATHRWVLHGPMKKYHRQHHLYPAKHSQTPLIIVAPAMALLWWFAGPPLMLGMLACWLWSGWLHRRLHTTRTSAGWMSKLQGHHMAHHRWETTNYGVLTVAWDRLLGTVDSIP